VREEILSSLFLPPGANSRQVCTKVRLDLPANVTQAIE
jgi:hypothetical protein